MPKELCRDVRLPEPICGQLRREQGGPKAEAGHGSRRLGGRRNERACGFRRRRFGRIGGNDCPVGVEMSLVVSALDGQGHWQRICLATTKYPLPPHLSPPFAFAFTCLIYASSYRLSRRACVLEPKLFSAYRRVRRSVCPSCFQYRILWNAHRPLSYFSHSLHPSTRLSTTLRHGLSPSLYHFVSIVPLPVYAMLAISTWIA